MMMMMQPMTMERENYRLTAWMLCRQESTVEEPWLFDLARRCLLLLSLNCFVFFLG